MVYCGKCGGKADTGYRCVKCGNDCNPSAASAGYGDITKQRVLGTACNKEQFMELLAPFTEDIPIRFDTKGPIEVVYLLDEDGGCIILR